MVQRVNQGKTSLLFREGNEAVETCRCWSWKEGAGAAICGTSCNCKCQRRSHIREASRLFDPAPSAASNFGKETNQIDRLALERVFWVCFWKSPCEPPMVWTSQLNLNFHCQMTTNIKYVTTFLLDSDYTLNMKRVFNAWLLMRLSNPKKIDSLLCWRRQQQKTKGKLNEGQLQVLGVNVQATWTNSK